VPALRGARTEGCIVPRTSPCQADLSEHCGLRIDWGVFNLEAMAAQLPGRQPVHPLQTTGDVYKYVAPSIAGRALFNMAIKSATRF